MVALTIRTRAGVSATIPSKIGAVRASVHEIHEKRIKTFSVLVEVVRAEPRQTDQNVGAIWGSCRRFE